MGYLVSNFKGEVSTAIYNSPSDQLILSSSSHDDTVNKKLDNTAILVLGMHRSGTSATSGILHRLGIALGSDPMTAQEDNPKGYYEHNTLSMLNEEILNSLGSSWDDPRSLPQGWPYSSIIVPFRNQLRSILLKEFSDASLWALKDPRLCRLLDLWLPLLDELKVEVKILHVLRHHSEVSTSLFIRNQMPLEQSTLLWMRYNLEAEKHSRNLSRTFLSYTDILTDWRTSFGRIGNTLNVEWPRPLDQAADEVNEFLDPSLRHHQAIAKYDNSAYPFQDETDSVYVSILGLETEKAKEALDGLMLDIDKPEMKTRAFNIYLKYTRNELQNTRIELQNTRIELQNTRIELQNTRIELAKIPRKIRILINPFGLFLVRLRSMLIKPKSCSILRSKQY